MKRFNKMALLAACFTLLLVACDKKEPPEKEIARPVKAVKVADASGFERWFPGRAKATQELELSFRVNGPLITRPVNVGDTVKADDIVARIDPRDYEVNLRNVNSQLEVAKADLELAESEFQRAQNIMKQDPGAISQARIDRQRQQRDAAKASVDALTASVDTAEDALSYTYLKASFDGKVVATYVENYEAVRAKQPIIRLLDASKIEMVINIPENLISNSQYVRNIRVVFDAFPELEIPAEVKEIGTEASQTTRTYPVTLIMAQPEGAEILPGMAGKVTADATPPSEEDKTQLQIPVAAIFSDQASNKTYAWVIDEGTQTVSRRELQVGAMTARGITVHGGLEPGEWVATAGVNTLREGQKVKLMQDQEG